MRKLHSLISLLLVLLMLAPCALADAPLLQAAYGLQSADMQRTRRFRQVRMCPRWDLNPGQTPYKGAALTN